MSLGTTESLGRDISQEELDFNDLFLYNPPGEDFPVGCDKDDPVVLFQNDKQPPLLVVDHHAAYVSSSIHPASGHNSSSRSPTRDNLSGAVFESLGLVSRPENIPAPSPRIEITPSGDSLSSQTHQPSPGSKVLAGYRECVSPASSNSSTGWAAETYSPAASPCVSPSNRSGCSVGFTALDLCPGLQGIHTSSANSSPGASPRNSVTDEPFLLPQHQRTAAPLLQQRSHSPHGKRAYVQAHSFQGGTPVKQRSRSPSPIPSPLEQQGSHYLHQAQAEFQTQVQGLGEEWSSSLSRPVPSVLVQGAHGQAQRQDCVYGEVYDWAIEQERIGRSGAGVKPDMVYMVPAVWPPSHPVQHGNFSGLSVTPLPQLDKQLPSQSGQYELLIRQQPRSHHRAHYETEGSRGAVKTPKGGHPEIQLCGYEGSAPLGLQVFIGTADERLLKPHAFYQVHRVTGKTVTTHSMEMMIQGTKVLEIPLEPKNHMRVVIDCVGILKLRNADIELRNGETDIGRKNTRVRLVFQIHVPHSGGRSVSLQVASEPIECSQRAQELPAVERQDLDLCSVLGGQQMVLTGQNFTPDSKVIFSEKTQEGQQIWEMEATVDKDKTQANMLFAEVPPYRDRTICHPAKVNFYVVNGKKNASQPQHFIYTPVIAVKAEPLDDYRLNSCGYPVPGLSVKPLYHHLEQDSHLQALNVSPTLYHLTNMDPRACVLTPDPLDDQSAYYQSRAGTLITSPMLYHTVNQHYSSCDTTLLNDSPMASYSASTRSQCVGARTPAGKLFEGPHVSDSCLMSRQQTMLPLGKSPPTRFTHGPGHGRAVCRVEPGGGNHEKWAPEKVTVKQENLSYAYLEDVNDIIRRDLKGHNGE
ncbi:nuclear factor of activated T-cells, cytoplasmic 2-like [Limanda limanda]|uniref:nuclear factor of activated T-cells, cytoplasmic 2-like n=1 Tax=Limanda limanda TaxID=27771 RepID=UPI0029C8FD37|nr:nuclear factor of activated T-cells, cytoplasmic 2-like [Limanda limanda]